MKILIACILLFLSTTVLAVEWKEIEGIYAVTSEGYLDPALSEPQDTHYRMQLRGNAARDMYNAMKVEAVLDDCTGGMAKNIESMQCIYFDNTRSHECHFSIRLQTQEIEYGVAS